MMVSLRENLPHLKIFFIFTETQKSEKYTLDVVLQDFMRLKILTQIIKSNKKSLTRAYEM
jgi:hypothetical protein